MLPIPKSDGDSILDCICGLPFGGIGEACVDTGDDGENGDRGIEEEFD